MVELLMVESFAYSKLRFEAHKHPPAQACADDLAPGGGLGNVDAPQPGVGHRLGEQSGACRVARGGAQGGRVWVRRAARMGAQGELVVADLWSALGERVGGTDSL
ncbi:hypothetical protein Adu01nite_84680 [Paractinoplanes durhamensis]|uniref:Uncharacterized protein n=1 Tax=Paractinoplanes durhamensis TaxID=113563 RepID=A0ABQ3ZBA6_9ACTN|nr:hypothetical protein Adu01nite_84680 [Actinoplanes durhamensis]